MPSLVECDVKIEMDESDPGPSNALNHGATGTQSAGHFSQWFAEVQSEPPTTDITTLTAPLKGKFIEDKKIKFIEDHNEIQWKYTIQYQLDQRYKGSVIVALARRCILFRNMVIPLDAFSVYTANSQREHTCKTYWLSNDIPVIGVELDLVDEDSITMRFNRFSTYGLGKNQMLGKHWKLLIIPMTAQESDPAKISKENLELRCEENVQSVSVSRHNKKKKTNGTDYPKWLSSFFPIKKTSVKNYFLGQMNEAHEDRFEIFRGHEPLELMDYGLLYIQERQNAIY